VCRDFAHLAVTLCRCMNVPARYCTDYLGHIGVPPDDCPMYFSAWDVMNPPRHISFCSLPLWHQNVSLAFILRAALTTNRTLGTSIHLISDRFTLQSRR
jgi:Transglutaminase-like superfamily